MFIAPSLRRSALLYAAAFCLFTLPGCMRFSGYAMNQSGQNAYRRGNYAMAAADFRRASMDNPTNPTYAYNLARTLAAQGQVQPAEAGFRRAISLDPAHQPSYHNLAALLTNTGRHGEAVALLEGWAGTQPYAPAAHLELAALREKEGNWAAAEQSLQTVLRMRPNHPYALAHLGNVYEQTGRGQQAVAMYGRSLRVNNAQPEVRTRMASLTRPTVIPGGPASAAFAGNTQVAFYRPGGAAIPTAALTPQAALGPLPAPSVTPVSHESAPLPPGVPPVELNTPQPLTPTTNPGLQPVPEPLSYQNPAYPAAPGQSFAMPISAPVYGASYSTPSAAALPEVPAF